MISDKINIAVSLPRNLWNELLGRAQSEHADETTLLVRAIEQFLQQTAIDPSITQRLERECAELAALDFSDMGSEEEWLVVQNEALHQTERDLG